MQTLVLSCAVLAAMGAVLRLLLSAVGKETVAALLQDIIGLSILLYLCTSLMQISFSIPSAVSKDTWDPQAIQADTLDKILSSAKENAEEQICNDIEKEFSIRPRECTVEIDQDTFTLERITIRFSNEDRWISGYTVKQFSEEKYGGKTEVTFHD